MIAMGSLWFLLPRAREQIERAVERRQPVSPDALAKYLEQAEGAVPAAMRRHIAELLRALPASAHPLRRSRRGRALKLLGYGEIRMREWTVRCYCEACERNKAAGERAWSRKAYEETQHRLYEQFGRSEGIATLEKWVETSDANPGYK